MTETAAAFKHCETEQCYGIANPKTGLCTICEERRMDEIRGVRTLPVEKPAEDKLAMFIWKFLPNVDKKHVYGPDELKNTAFGPRRYEELKAMIDIMREKSGG